MNQDKPGFFQKNKKELIGTGIGTVAGASIGALAARSKARRQADEMGLSDRERRAYVRRKTLGGTAIGAGVGAAAGFGASKIPFKKGDGSGKSSTLQEAGNFAVAEKFANHPDAKLANMSYEAYLKKHPGTSEAAFRHKQRVARENIQAMQFKAQVARHEDKNDSFKLNDDVLAATKARVEKHDKMTAIRAKAKGNIEAKINDIMGDPKLSNAQKLEQVAKYQNALKSYSDSKIEYLYNIKNKLMSTIIFDEETRSFSVIEDHMYADNQVKQHIGKYKAYYGMGAGAAIGAGAGAAIARKKAIKEADRRGLTGAARKRFINQKTGAGAGIGLGTGAIVGTGAAVGHEFGKQYRAANIESKYGMTVADWNKLTSAEKAERRARFKDIKQDAKLDLKDLLKEAKENRNRALEAAGDDKRAKLAAKRAYRTDVNYAKDLYQQGISATGKSRKALYKNKTKNTWSKLFQPNE